MRHARTKLAQMGSAALLVVVAGAVPASADEAPKPMTDPTQAAALAHKLGDDQTGGVYYEDGQLVVTVTDRRNVQTIRETGATPKLVTRSAAELASIHRELNALGGIPNTAWGAEARTNQVNVEIFDGVSAADRARIERVAAAHPGAIRIDRIKAKLRFKGEIRGANGITSDGWLCSAGFNTMNSAGSRFTLTAGHCVPGTGNQWYMNWNGEWIGPQIAYKNGGGDATTGGDWAVIRPDSPDIKLIGSVRYHGGTYHDISNSRFAAEQEDSDRVGVTSMDTTGHITKTSVTVNIGGKEMYNMYESSHCALGGDSGGPLLHGATALGLLSGGSDETTCNSSSTGTYRNYYTKVQNVLNDRGLRVY